VVRAGRLCAVKWTLSGLLSLCRFFDSGLIGQAAKRCICLLCRVVRARWWRAEARIEDFGAGTCGEPEAVLPLRLWALLCGAAVGYSHSGAGMLMAKKLGPSQHQE
ncbi:hypothetical protein, partial [Allochromatium humboldtianum]|uniref:hypothetical protein n=1 Tax=Allochromatium humboldtianum TaxID=504901 RepID=UPI001CA411CD